jgi:peptide/nickel transport system substrate-binding protein
MRPDDAIVVILPREPEQLDPRFVGDAYGLKLTRIIHASLVRIHPLTLEPVPELATAIDIEDATHYRVHLRPNLQFSDGSALDADDVVATFRALADPGVKSRYISTYGRIKRVDKIGPLEVLFELNAPHATFVTDLEVPVLRAEDAFSPPNAQHPPLGAGPYRLLARTRGYVDLERNPRYSADRGAPPRLRFLVIRDDNTRALRMLAGAGDLSLNAIPSLLVPLFEHAPQFRVRSTSGVGTTYLGMNLLHPKLRDLRVRTALAHALSREALVRHKLGGRAQLALGFVPPGHWAYTEDLPRYDFDVQRARSLLDAAGLPLENGTRLSLTLRTSSDRSIVSISRALAAMLGEVGIDVEVRPSESATLLADLARGRFELTFLQLPELFEPHVLSWFFGGDHIPEPGKREGGNRWRYHSVEFDDALEQGRSHVRREERIAAYVRAQQIMAHDLPVIPLWHEDVVAVTSPRLARYRVPRDARFATLAEMNERAP